ncbi:MAG: hypothetical protein ACYDCH_12615 [Gaiellaceae bacterium]
MDAPLAFRVEGREEPGLEVRVNFGVYSGRNATGAEIDDLAHLLRDAAPSFAIVAEARHEFGGDVETALHQVVIEVERASVGDDPDALCARIVATANAWAEACIAARSELGELRDV